MILVLVLSSVVLIAIFGFFRLSYGKSKIASSSYQSQLLLNIAQEIVQQREAQISQLSLEDILNIPSAGCSIVPCITDKLAPEALIKKPGVWWETTDRKKVKAENFAEIQVKTYSAIEKLETVSSEVYFRITVYVKQATTGSVRRVQAVVSRPLESGIVKRRSWAVH